MIVLDTNVVSEAMRADAARQVIDWLDSHPVQSLAVTSITFAEILFGIRRLPEGQRRNALQESFDTFMMRGLRDRILSFDSAAADAYAHIVVNRMRRGRRLEALDAMIAGIALSRGADIATRNTPDFDDCGFRVFNPWE